MTAAIGKFVFGKVLNENIKNHFGTEDPYFEVPAENLGKIGKLTHRRKKKALPPGITEEEGKILTKVKRRAYRLDMSLGKFLGLKVGWGSVIGFVPLIGDAADCTLSLLVVKTAMKADLPAGTIVYMLVNVAFDFAIGLIPIVGDLIDMGYKCNTRNAVILEKYLRKRGAANLKAQGIIGVEDPSLPDYSSDDPHALEDIESQRRTNTEPSRQKSERIRRDDSRRRDGRMVDESRTRSKSKSKGSRRERDEIRDGDGDRRRDDRPRERERDRDSEERDLDRRERRREREDRERRQDDRTRQTDGRGTYR